MGKNSNLELDEIGCWSEVKLDILRDYAPAYTTIMSRQSFIKGYYYIDGFAGYGIHKSKTRNEFIHGSPSIALQVVPAFTGYHFVDLNSKKVEYLKASTATYPNARVYEGDCNKVLMEQIFPIVRYEQFKRALCLLDPYGLDLSWEVIFTSGQSKSIEIFLNFPIMDMNRNILLKNPDKVFPAQADRMTFFWGDESWKEVAYRKQKGLFDILEEKTSNQVMAVAFQKRLKEIAGFGYVPEPMPMRNTRGAIVYYLFFATPNKTGNKIVENIMRKYRNRRAV